LVQLRLVLAVSLDGRLAPPEGGAAQLGGRGDRRLLEEALAWADATLVGAETLRRHGSLCLIRHPDLLRRRHREGRSPQPIAIVVSRAAELPAHLPFFRQPLQRWWLGPAAASTAAPVTLPPGFERHLALEGWPALRAALPSHGIERLAVLGGARLAAALLAEDCIDELQLTLCPRLLGGSHCWVPAAAAPGLPASCWELLEQRPLGDGELLLRYRLHRPAMAGSALTDFSEEDRGGRSGGPVPATARP
jgi:5-amino-6-(5-phosphoribosylamino)uracil reductase